MRETQQTETLLYGPISTGVQKQMTVGVRAVMTSGTDGLFGRVMGASGTSEVFHTLILVVFTWRSVYIEKISGFASRCMHHIKHGLYLCDDDEKSLLGAISSVAKSVWTHSWICALDHYSQYLWRECRGADRHSVSWFSYLPSGHHTLGPRR